MMNVPIKHTGLPAPINIVSTWAAIDGTKSWDEIEKTIVDSIKVYLQDPLFLYTYFITLIDTDEHEYPLDGFTRIRKLLNTKGPNSKIKELKVIWSPKSNTRPAELIAKDNTSTPTDIQFQTTDPCLCSDGGLLDEYLKDDIVPSSVDIDKDEEFNKIYSDWINESNTDQTEISDNVSIGNRRKLFKDFSLTFSPIQQTNSTPTSSSSEEHLNQTEGQDNDSVANQSQCSVKRSNQSEGDTTPKKRKKRISKRDQSCTIVPATIMNTYLTENRKPNFNETTYDPSSVPVISIFAKDKMIQFKEKIDQIERSRYLEEGKVPRIQSKKKRNSENNDKSRDSTSPVITLPLANELQIPFYRNPVLLAFACVKEHRSVEIDGKEGIEFCHVGYQKFIYYSKEAAKMLPMSVIYPNEEDKKAGQLIFQITPVSDGKNEYTLMAHPFKVNDKSEKEIGPAMFRLSAEYIQAARENGFEFGQKGPAHRYVAYLFKFNEQSNRYEPDFETLVLSDYMFYDSNKKKKNQQNDALQN